MPKSVDFAIYGADDNDFAEKCASSALNPAGVNVDWADYWGSVQDSRSMSKSNVGAESLGPTDPDTPVSGKDILKGHRQGSNAGNFGDRESVRMPPQWTSDNRHKRGPSTSTDEGGGVKSPPPRNQLATRKGGEPKP